MHSTIIDVVTDTLLRLHERHAKIPQALLLDVEREIRADWGGEWHYVPRTGEDTRAALAERDRVILADHRRGDHAELIARRHGISVRRVWQIIAALKS